MRERDPLLPLLGVTVIGLVIVTVGFVFYPRLSRWLGPSREAVTGAPLAPAASVPVWVCRSEEGVAILIQGGLDGAQDAALDGGLAGGPYHYLQLSVYNFGREDGYTLDLPEKGFGSPEGGPAAVPAAARLRADAPAHLRAVLVGLGAVSRLSVEKGRSGHALLVVEADPARRTAFVSGALRCERRELARRTLASWRQRPDWEEFQDF